MKVIDIIKEAEEKGGKRFSIELLPPLKGDGLDKIFHAITTLLPYEPAFINVTSSREQMKYVERPDGLINLPDGGGEKEKEAVPQTETAEPTTEAPTTPAITPGRPHCWDARTIGGMNAKLEPRNTGTILFVTRWKINVPSPAEKRAVEGSIPTRSGISTVAPKATNRNCMPTTVFLRGGRGELSMELTMIFLL